MNKNKVSSDQGSMCKNLSERSFFGCDCLMRRGGSIISMVIHACSNRTRICVSEFNYVKAGSSRLENGNSFCVFRLYMFIF
jgi:hypothetical protein